MASEQEPELSVAEAAFVAVLRGHVMHTDAEAEQRAETLIERLRQTLPHTLPAEETPPPPTMLEHFRIEHELGRGGMGTVYRAFDTRLQRSVAVKVLLPKLARDARFRERFLREARTAAALDHPNVVPTQYVGEAQGLPFLVMPLLQGQSLHTWLRQQHEPPSIATTQHIIRELANGLAAFHQQGMIHRDVKPSNIWLETDAAGTVRSVKLLDFGLARAATAEPLTEHGAILGTPAYMAPEQARGTTVDARADIFSLGGVLYQLLTLQQAFRGPDPLATLLSLAADTPPSPSTLNPSCPPALAALCMELLAKEPDQRPRSVADVLERLATNTAPAPRTRRRFLVGAILAVLLLLAGTYYVVTNKGTLIIETDDPNVTVTLEDAGGKVTILDPARQRAWRINTGTYQVHVAGDDRAIDLPNPFTVRRGDQLLATVRTVKRPPPAPISDRVVAEKLLQLGGTVTVEQARKAAMIKQVRDLPAGDVHLLEVNFFGNVKLADRDLAVLEHAPHLWNVNLSHTRITDAGLKHVLGLPKLHSLSLDGSQVTSAGLPLLKECRELRGLGLSFSKVDRTGLAHLQALPELESLGLCGLGLQDADLAQLQPLTKLRDLAFDLNPLTNESLVHLKRFNQLKKVGLVTTKVTLDGAKQLATDLPECRIILEGHVIEPSAPKRQR